MAFCDWLPAPVGIDASRWVSRPGRRNALVVAHTVTSCQRLLDVVEHIETDPRIQVVFTVAPDAFNHGVGAFLNAMGAVVLPWPQATRERFDLALAAAYGGLHELHAPVVVMAHGAGFGKRAARGCGAGPAAAQRPVYGLDAQRLTRDGKVLASALVLSHDSQLGVLRRQCPEAAPVAVVAGDLCFDRLVASLPRRPRYRAAFGVTADQELVVVSSTWGRHGLFGHHPDLLPQLMTQLPASGFRVAALLHPAVWSAHGRRQIKAWLSECRQAGLLLIEPEADWRSALAAADCVVGDHGSVTAYAAAIGRRVLHLAPPVTALPAPGSAQERVTANAAALDTGRSLLDQIRGARAVDAEAVAGLLTSRPGQAAMALRRAMYRLLNLPEPGRHRRCEPAPVPTASEVASL